MQVSITINHHLAAEQDKAPARAVLSYEEAADIIFTRISKIQPGLMSWLGEQFPKTPYVEFEDQHQQLLVDIWGKGLGMLGLPSLKSFDTGFTREELEKLLETLEWLLVIRLRKHLKRRVLSYLRWRKRIKNGGQFKHVDIADEALQVPARGSGRSLVAECAEGLGEVIEWFSKGLSIREDIVFQIWLTSLPHIPSTQEIYDQLTPAQRAEFLPRDERELSADAEESAIKAQISRTKAAVLAHVARFGREK